MVITDIQKQKHNEKRYSVFVDGEYCFSVSEIDLLFYKLEVGGEISPEKVEEIKAANDYIRAKTVAARFLGYRMRSRKEVYLRLKKEELSEETIEKTLDFLTEYGYIDDLAFAKAYIKEKKALGNYGGRRIKQELYEKGVSGGIISQLSEELCEGEDEGIKKAIDKKLKGRRISDRKELQRLYGHLLRKGFSYGDIKAALSEYTETEDFDFGEE